MTPRPSSRFGVWANLLVVLSLLFSSVSVAAVAPAQEAASALPRDPAPGGRGEERAPPASPWRAAGAPQATSTAVLTPTLTATPTLTITPSPTATVIIGPTLPPRRR
jgi:hypothetical protein